MGIAEIYECFKSSYKIAKDTRLDVENAVYFSLKGGNFDGNRYAQDALNKGAHYAVIDNPDFQTDERMILVDDSLQCLQDLARYHRKQLGIPLIALTGSNGKTTTKELMYAVLSRKFNCFATKGNLNNHIGVPMTLLAMTPETEIGVVEMGANHPGEIAALCDIALPDYGFITNFGRVHLEGFGSLDGVIRAKTEMYRHLRDHGKKVFINAVDEVQMERSAGMDRVTFGTSESTYPVSFVKADPFVVLEFNHTSVNSNLIGSYNYSNMAAATAVGRYFEVSAADIKNGIEGYVPSNNRSQLVDKGTNRIILDAYNANPNSMEAALANLNQLKDNKKIAVLGDMFEIGDRSLEEHQRIADIVQAMDLHAAYLIGSTFSQAEVRSERIRQFNTFEEFSREFSPQSLTNCTILIKASRGMALERVLDLF